MLSVMCDPAADNRRRNAMATAAAPYLHPRLTAIDAKLSADAAAAAREEPLSMKIEFVMPSADHVCGDQD
jgi:hypothetical protein